MAESRLATWRARVLIDVETIGAGGNFPAVISEGVGFCEVLLARHRARVDEQHGAEGRRRLDHPADWVRLEITAVLTSRGEVALDPLDFQNRQPCGERSAF